MLPISDFLLQLSVGLRQSFGKLGRSGVSLGNSRQIGREKAGQQKTGGRGAPGIPRGSYGHELRHGRTRNDPASSGHVESFAQADLVLAWVERLFKHVAVGGSQSRSVVVERVFIGRIRAVDQPDVDPGWAQRAESLFDELSWAKNTHENALQMLAAILHGVENGLLLVDRNEESHFPAIAGFHKQRDPVGQRGLSEVASSADRLAADRIGGEIRSQDPYPGVARFGKQDWKVFVPLRRAGPGRPLDSLNAGMIFEQRRGELVELLARDLIGTDVERSERLHDKEIRFQYSPQGQNVVLAGLLELLPDEAVFIGTERDEQRRGQNEPNEQHHDHYNVPPLAASIANTAIRRFWLVTHHRNSPAPSCHAGKSYSLAVHPASNTPLTKTGRGG